MSAKTQIKLTPEVLDILNRSEITDTTLKLPDIKLERDLYVAVDKVIKLAGGKWNRGRGVHLFNKDPREVLGLALESGEIVDKKKLFQFYPTPLDAAKQVWEIAGVEPNMSLLEPSAGDGDLLKAIPDGFFTPDGTLEVVELDEKHREVLYKETKRVLARWATASICCPGDFLTEFKGGPAFDRIIMNPPFSKGQDVKHLQHAWGFLKPGGRLVAILPGKLTETSPMLMDFDTTDINCYPLPAGTFKEAGTNIVTTIVSLDK